MNLNGTRYRLVTWPESQMAMNTPGAILADDGVAGPCAYFIPEAVAQEVMYIVTAEGNTLPTICKRTRKDAEEVLTHNGFHATEDPNVFTSDFNSSYTIRKVRVVDTE